MFLFNALILALLPFVAQGQDQCDDSPFQFKNNDDDYVDCNEIVIGDDDCNSGKGKKHCKKTCGYDVCGTSSTATFKIWYDGKIKRKDCDWFDSPEKCADVQTTDFDIVGGLSTCPEQCDPIKLLQDQIDVIRDEMAIKDDMAFDCDEEVCTGKDNMKFVIPTALIVGQINDGCGYGTAAFSVDAEGGNCPEGDGSVVFGSGSTASGTGSTVTGGQGSVAGGEYSSVGGGSGNQANGGWSSVTGGGFNVADNDYSFVASGYSNLADGDFASVIGGLLNKATGQYTYIGGGSGGEAMANYKAVHGASP